jgi:hypothetical protein
VIFFGQIANDAPNRQWQKLDQGWRGNNLILLGKLRLQINVNDFKIKSTGQMLGTDLFQIF